ncbi:hypothetical protein GF362_04550 [Candidatus Dojkabacteria bacterium]|nr:hypothetical protein [Candidatus Dojkabacteria bacterium]
MEDLKPLTFCTRTDNPIKGLARGHNEKTYRIYTRLVDCSGGQRPANIPFYTNDDTLKVSPDSADWEKYNPVCHGCEMPASKLCVNGPHARDVIQSCPLIGDIPLIPYNSKVINIEDPL